MRRDVASVIVDVMDTDIAPVELHTGSRVWAQTFARVYEPLLWAGERTGLRERRRALLAQARGRTIEIGAGTGLNLRHYPAGVDELVLAEPDDDMRRRLTKHSSRSQPSFTCDRRARGTAAVSGRLRRHGRLDPRVVHGGDARSRAPGDRTGAEARWPAALHRTRPIGLTAARPLAGSARRSLAPIRPRVSLQPRHRGADGCLRVRVGAPRHRHMARGAAPRTSAHHRQRAARRPERLTSDDERPGRTVSSGRRR